MPDNYDLIYEKHMLEKWKIKNANNRSKNFR